MEQGHESGSGNAGSTHSPAASKSPAPASAARKYGDGTSVNGNASEQEAFDTYKKATGNAPASKEALRTWLASRQQRAASPSVAA